MKVLRHQFKVNTVHEKGNGSHGERILRAVGFVPVSQAHASRKQRGQRGYQICHSHKGAA